MFGLSPDTVNLLLAVAGLVVGWLARHRGVLAPSVPAASQPPIPSPQPPTPEPLVQRLLDLLEKRLEPAAAPVKVP